MSFNFRSNGNRRRPDRATQLAELRALALHVLRGVGWTALTAAAAALVLYGGRQAYRYFTTTDTFAVDQIQVAGDVGGGGSGGAAGPRLSPDQIRAVSGLVLGQNIFRVGLSEARSRLEQNPWVRTATVSRGLPRRLLIRVEQRRAVAYVELSGLYLIDDREQIFKRATADDDLDLPTITGLSRRDFIAGKEELREQLTSALAFIQAPSDAGNGEHALPWEPGELSEVHFDEDLGITLELGSLPTAIHLGFPPFEDKLERLRRARSQLAQRQLRASALYLDDSRQPDRVGMALAGPTP